MNFKLKVGEMICPWHGFEFIVLTSDGICIEFNKCGDNVSYFKFGGFE